MCKTLFSMDFELALGSWTTMVYRSIKKTDTLRE